ncbi:MAG TPA: biotin-dependent carboxyltransferase family protein [Nocardioidaceae bacterium]|nr:biotin-dependent carboxyltransferase family protein [Nocardioidaceae bacterium]
MTALASERTLQVVRAGPMSTVQDRGRPRWAHLGVPRAGALDAPAAALANRLVGNPPDAAVLEVTFGGLSVRPSQTVTVAVTGAPGPVAVDVRAAAWGEPVSVRAGRLLQVGTPTVGVRSYLAVAGGIAVAPVLGSRSTDTLAGIGPPVLADDDELPLGASAEPPASIGVAAVRQDGDPGRTGLRVLPGPRLDWFAEDAWTTLTRATYTVQAESNRVGVRLQGPRLVRSRHEELASEGIVLGAVQVRASGLPLVFLADHPTTGGYPVIAVVHPDDLWRCAQLRPGEPLTFHPA